MTTPAISRPASFDDMLVAHLDALHRVVRRQTRYGRDEIASDAIADILRNWSRFDPSKASFYTWMCWRIRGAVSNYRQKKQRVWDAEILTDQPEDRSVMPSQEHALMLGQICRRAGEERNVRAAVLAGSGMSSNEIGAALGVVPIYANKCVNDGRRALAEAA